MNFELRQEHFQKTLRQRNFAYVISGGLLLANILLSIKALHHEERWVLIPQFEIAQTYTIQGDQYDEHYLEHWAGALTQDFLTVNPSTVDQAMERFLKIASTQYGQIKPNIEALAKEIKDNQITTAFYPKEFKIDTSNHVVDVTGTFMTWFGREKPPIVQNKTFLVGWKPGPKGILLASQFEERKPS